MVSPLHTVLPSVILSIVEHIPDADTAQLVATMSERQAFSPTTPSWLDNWKLVLSIGDLYTDQRSSTRHVIMDALQAVWLFVKDISVSGATVLLGQEVCGLCIELEIDDAIGRTCHNMSENICVVRAEKSRNQFD